MIRKNLGHINLKKILASVALMSLLIAGATSADWNKIIPTIKEDNIKGKFFISAIYNSFSK